MTPAEKKAITAKEVENELRKKKEELGEEELDRRVKERMTAYQEATLKDAEEARERDRKEAQRKLERLERAELGEEEDIAVIEDDDFVIQGPSAEEWERMQHSGWGGSETTFVDVRIKDAQRAFNASKDARKVVLSSKRVEGAEGEMEEKMDTEDKEEKCTSYEEDEEEEEEKGKRKEQKEREQDKPKQEEEKESEEEDEAKWGEIWEEMYGEGEYSIEEDADTVAKFASAGGYDVESESQSVAMVARLIRKIKSFREEREREEGGSREEEETGKEEKESKKEGETKKEEERESRRERKRGKETDKKERSKSRRDTSVEKRSKRPPLRQVRDSSSAKEDD